MSERPWRPTSSMKELFANASQRMDGGPRYGTKQRDEFWMVTDGIHDYGKFPTKRAARKALRCAGFKPHWFGQWIAFWHTHILTEKGEGWPVPLMPVSSEAIWYPPWNRL